MQQFDPLEGNYWGYMTLNFFAPHLAYAQQESPEGAIAEFRWMVDELHKAGIEVFLDVVYNHTTEADVHGPTYSFRGIDNSTYYALDPADFSALRGLQRVRQRSAHRASGGAPAGGRQPALLDAPRWAWTASASTSRPSSHATTTARSTWTTPRSSRRSAAIRTSPMSALIAEPWQGEPGGGYLMGRAFPGMTWRQWNDHFRDAVRGFVRGDEGLVPALMTRLYGSTDLLPDTRMDAFRRYQSINYVDSHDGLKLRDLVSYTDEGQHSWNCGFEGTDGAPADVAALRRQQVKNFCALLMLSNGTPMFVAGDEFMHTQFGNANPWNQDNETTWLDWSLAEANADMVRFFAMMIAFRKAHPSIGRSTGWGADVTWHGVGADADLTPASHSLAFHLRGAASVTQIST